LHYVLGVDNKVTQLQQLCTVKTETSQRGMFDYDLLTLLLRP